jgi:hypothetical protein
MRIRAGVIALVIVVAGILTACQPANSTSTVPPTSSPVARRATPTPAPTPTPPLALVVQKVGAVATPSGFTAFAVVDNPSGQTAMAVNVQITALGPGGQVLTRRSGTIPRIAPGEREAMALGFPVGRTLPVQFTGSVIGVRWTPASTSDTARVASSSFVQDARTPSVRVHLVNTGVSAARLAVTAVCWDGTGNIRGGGSRTVMVGPDARGHDVVIEVAISTVPARCDSYGITVS